MFNLIPLLFCFVFLLRLFNIQISYCNYFHAQRQLKNQYAYLFVGYSLDHKFDKELTMLPLNNSKTIQLGHGIHSLVLSLHESNDPKPYIIYEWCFTLRCYYNLCTHSLFNFSKKISSLPNLHKSFHCGETS